MSENSKSNVIPMPVKPKQLNRQYRSHAYTITYIPKTKKWKWTVTVTTKMVYSEEADTQVKAIRAAEKFIDKTCPKGNS